MERWSLRLRVFLLFAGLAAASWGALGAGLWAGYHRLGDTTVLPAFVQAGVVAGFAILGLTAGIWYLFDENVARAIERLAGGMRARTHAAVTGELDASPARYLGDLAPAAAAVTLTLAETRNALAEAVARETTRLQAEKDRLEALLSDVPVGVLLCTGDHQLVFYNGQAVDLLGGGAAPGLDRRLFDYLRQAPVAHAHARLLEAGDPDAASDLLVATVAGARVLAGRMRLLDQGRDGPGYVLTLRDVTADLAAHAERGALLAEVFDRVRRPAANLQTVIGVLAEDEGAGPALTPALTGAMLEEVGSLASAITELGARYDDSRSDWWPLAFTRASDLADGIRARIEAAGLEVTADPAPILLRCDGFEIVALVSVLAERVAAAGLARSFALEIVEDGAGAMVRLGWQGPALPLGQLDGWLGEPLEVGLADVTGRSVLLTHATECWPDRDAAGRAGICLPVREARRAHRRPPPVTRAVVYDFDLLSKARNAGVLDSRLEDLTYVVFDTETTGLLPAQGDEIVQIAAVRIVNGRRVEKEVFDTLVNPGRSIPAGSTEVHGITGAMVADAPRIEEVGRQFHKFAEGAVLVAHNAPFDMEFLRRHEAGIGASFDNPILDTVLLSAVVFGQGETHSLDALTHRLGITIPEEARHTAIGDTVATADAFLRLLPMLRAKGMVTFGDVLAEVRKHGRLLKDLNG
ncbi:DNA polymerase III subunit epsilon [Frigidibacter albus]|nr:exonuclease domain-containing protein [Frigidibacter albus]GGH54005.1 DNA polymerase III subunit epsilon [Frigidibacter albus]